MARPSGTKNIETPEKMWDYFLAYKKNVKDNPRAKLEITSISNQNGKRN